MPGRRPTTTTTGLRSCVVSAGADQGVLRHPPAHGYRAMIGADASCSFCAFGRPGAQPAGSLWTIAQSVLIKTASPNDDVRRTGRRSAAR